MKQLASKKHYTTYNKNCHIFLCDSLIQMYLWLLYKLHKNALLVSLGLEGSFDFIFCIFFCYRNKKKKATFFVGMLVCEFCNSVLSNFCFNGIRKWEINLFCEILKNTYFMCNKSKNDPLRYFNILLSNLELFLIAYIYMYGQNWRDVIFAKFTDMLQFLCLLHLICDLMSF